MKNIARMLPPIVLLTALLIATGPARSAYADPGRGSFRENLTYGYAQVLRVDPAYEANTAPPRCVEHRSGKSAGGTVLGAIVGGALGNQVGKGNGRKAATVAGAVAGGAIGHSIAKNKESASTYECPAGYAQPQRRLIGYDVEYTYKGENYMSRLPYDPGNRLRVRVSVTPDEGTRP